MKPPVRARILGLAVAGAGILDVMSALTPALRSRLAELQGYLTPWARGFAAGTASAAGLILILLGRGVWMRRRIAYRVTVVLLGLSAFAHVAKGLDVEEAAVALGLLVLLVLNRNVFTIGYEVTRWRAVARAIVVIVGLDVAYGLVGFFLRRSAIGPDPTPLRIVETLGSRLIGMQGPLHVSGFFGHWFPASLTVVGAASMAAIVGLILKPVADSAVHHVWADRDIVRSLMNRPDGDTLDFFALRRDKRYVFSTDRRAVIAYRCFNGVGLASGDPIGDSESFVDAASRFMDTCDRHGWRPAVLGARGGRTAIWEAVGLRPLYLGDEAIIDVESFSLEGRKIRNVRQSLVHARRAGITTEVRREGDLDIHLRRRLRDLAERARRGAPERGFSMALGGVLDGTEPSCTVVIARDPSGTPVGFQRYVPCRMGDVLSLDVMRREPDSPNGVNELMIVDLVAYAGEHGIAQVSLNFAAFRGLIDPDEELSFVRSAGAWFIKRLSPHFKMESLQRFNEKFRPRWVPRYLMYRSMSDFAAVGIASLNAEQLVGKDRAAELARVPTGAVN